MSEATVTAQSRARQACEPCRRKKTKCPGEKPICSFCQRLNQTCTYQRTSDLTRVSKHRQNEQSVENHGSNQRLHRLEERVDQILDALNILSGTQASATSSAHRLASSLLSKDNHRQARPSQTPEGSDAPSNVTCALQFDQFQRPIPPAEVMVSLEEIYRTKLDCQPLQLLDVERLSLGNADVARHLLFSFLSLTVRFSEHEFFRGVRSQAVDYYMNSATALLSSQVAVAMGSLDVLQALCLVSFGQIIAGKPVKAWMNIGIAVRLAICTGFTTMGSVQPATPTDSDDVKRCCWSLFVLDRLYGSNLQILPALTDEKVLPAYPSSAHTPPPPTDLSTSVAPVDVESSHIPLVDDLGIHAYCLQLLSTWGHLMSYTRRIKDGDIETPWAPNSAYQNLVAEMCQFETALPEVHRFRLARFQDRSMAELEAHCQYWTPWLFLQFIYHGIRGLMNHPLFHLVRAEERQSGRSPSFSQHVIDQAILHSGWVIFMIDTCEEKSFLVKDPFIGHLVAITATIYVFLTSSKDEALSSKARRAFDKCFAFVEVMAAQWDHLRHTTNKLMKLREVISRRRPPLSPGSRPQADMSLLWNLLDYSVSAAPPPPAEAPSEAVDLDVNTQFLSPLNDTSLQHATHQPTEDSPSRHEHGENIFNIEGMSYDLLNNSQMNDMSNMVATGDFWTFGQL